MNYKIICENENIEFTNNYPAFTFFDDVNRCFYRVKDDIIEVNYLDINNINECCAFKRKYKIIFIILKSIDEHKIEKVKNFLKYNNVVVAVMRKSLFLENENIVVLNGLDEKINVEALISMFSNKEILLKVKNKSSSIFIGDESLQRSTKKLMLDMLRSFECIDSYKEYIMYLYSSKEFNLQETTYFEDLMREYLYNSEKIEIKQFKDSEIKDNVFYSILGTK